MPTSHFKLFVCSLTVFLLKCYCTIRHDLNYTLGSESGEDHGLLPVEYTVNATPYSRTGKYQNRKSL